MCGAATVVKARVERVCLRALDDCLWAREGIEGFFGGPAAPEHRLLEARGIPERVEKWAEVGVVAE